MDTRHYPVTDADGGCRRLGFPVNLLTGFTANLLTMVLTTPAASFSKKFCCTVFGLFLLVFSAGNAFAWQSSANMRYTLTSPFDLSMAWVAGGEFQMGDLAGTGQSDERPVRTIALPGFWIMHTEVTLNMFQHFVDATGYAMADGCGYFDGGWKQDQELNWRNPGFPQSQEHPVTCISWDDANQFASWLSDTTGQTFTLPTEVQWEYAARAQTGSAYSFGDNASLLCTYANGADQSALADYPDFDVTDCNDEYTRTAPVASYRDNAYGLHDMTGNVWEWVKDCYTQNYETAAAPSGNSEPDCERRVYRGGGYGDVPFFLRVSLRNRGYPDERRDDVGFRLVLNKWSWEQ